MTHSQDRPYIPQVGAPTMVFLGALTVTTALPTVFLVQAQTPPLWLTSVTFALLLTAVLLVPKMNAHTRLSSRRARSLNLALIAAAILIPAVLLIVATVGVGSGWLTAVGVGVQLVLLLSSGILAARDRDR